MKLQSRQFKFDGIKYKILVKKPADPKLVGEVNFDENVIRIDPKLSIEAQRSVLFHEILHIILKKFQSRKIKKSILVSEEKLVLFLETQIFLLRHKNKELFRELFI